MWFCYFLIVVTLDASVRSEDFYIDHKTCLLSSKDNSIIIDLSRAQLHEEHEGYLVVISLCQRNKKQKNCPKNSLVCVIDQEKNKTIDAGSQVTNITPSGPKAFDVEIESKFGIGTLTVMCRENNEEGRGLVERTMEEATESYVRKGFGVYFNNFLNINVNNASPWIQNFETDTPFKYSIMWMSAAACPQKVYRATNSCILYTKGVSYDLRPLQQAEDFIVPLDDGVYFVIGICRNAHEAQCLSAVCRRSADGIVSIAKAQDQQLNHIHGRGLELVYINTIGNEQTVIKFECSEKTTEPVISFVEEYHGNYFFTLATDMVCPPPTMDCLVFDDKKEYHYDLSPLYRLADNWEIVNKNVGRILFNLCGPLNYIPHIPCTGKKMFACIFDEKTKAETFGNKVDIKIVSPGNLSLNITGPANFSLDIVLECSYHENHPYMNDSYGNTLFWKTVTACPSKVFKGNDCKAVNLYSNSSVDLTPLRKKNEDYLINVGEDSFRINICGNLMEKCSQTSEASVCYKNKEGKEFAIGQTGSKELVFKDGQFMFYLEGEPCNENATKSEIHIILKCEYLENSQGQEFSYSHLEYFDKVNTCEFYFHWRTNYVCKERSTTPNCSFQKGNKLYDLSSLRNLKDNYSIQLNKSLKAVLNVCHSVIPGHRIRCLPRAGACLLSGHPEYILANNYQERKMYETLGLVSNSGNFDYVNGSLRLSYLGGGVCKDPDHGSQSTTIIFFCNESALDTEPIFKGEEKCEFRFEWTTRAACPRYLGGTTPSPISTVTDATTTESITTLKPVERIQSCSVKDPKTNKRFDLTVLMSKPWTITGKNITIGICRPIKNSLCSENSGACSFLKEGGSINIGDYNTDLTYEEDSLYLQYKTANHITKIEFVCSTMDLGPKFIGERMTSYGLVSFISWPTHLACDKETELNCCKDINKLCDYYNGTYEVPIDEKQSAFLSLCRPVIPKMGLLCTNNTPACIGAHTSDHSFSGEKILGKISKKPVLHKSNTSFVLEYISGSLCDSSNALYSTLIRFFCDQNASENYPRFHHIENYCKYVFDWGSPLLCDEKLPERKINCTFLGKTYAIEELKVDKLVGARGEYILNFCKMSSKCRGQVCKKPSGDRSWHDFSIKNTSVIGHKDENSRIIIDYLGIEETSKCGATVEILCDVKHSTFSDSSLIKETDCYIHVVLKHKLACSLPLQSKDMSNPQGGSFTLVWFGVLALTLILAILFGLYWYRKRKPEFPRSVNRILRYRKLNNSSQPSLDLDNCSDSVVIFEVISKQD